MQCSKEVESQIGPVIYRCARPRTDADLKVSNAIGAFFIGILIVTLLVVLVMTLLVTLGRVQKDIAVLAMLGGIVVLSPIAIAVTYLRSVRTMRRFQFNLHERGVRYLSHYWIMNDIVAVRRMSSVHGLDQSLVAQVILTLKPGLKSGMREMREDTIHFEWIDGTKPNLITALECFQQEDVGELLHRMSHLNPAIEMD